MDYSITQNGMILDKSLYSIDLDTKVFSSKEDGLVIDFSGQDVWTFKTGHYCTFRTGYSCIFNAGSHCTFYTYGYCTFNTANFCTFTGSDCTFSIWAISSQKFKSGSSGIILDRKDSKHYLLNEEFIRLQKILKG